MLSKTAETKVYLDYSQAELDRAYTQTEWASNVSALLAKWALKGETFRAAAVGYKEAAYGASSDERIDVFAARGSVVHFHIHGGAWQRQSKEDCSFLAEPMLEIGTSFVAPEFARLPKVRMPDVLDQIAGALVWTYETMIRNGPAESIVVSGHSSGAHMAALLASYDFDAALPPSALRAVLCLSGPYDLHPVMLSARRRYIDLQAEEVRRLSPLHRIEQTARPLHLFYGSRESPEFRRQSQAFARALDAGGKLACCHEIAQTNHFEIVEHLGDFDTLIGTCLRDLLTKCEKTV